MIQRHGKVIAGVVVILGAGLAAVFFASRPTARVATPREELLQLRSSPFASPIVGRLSGERDSLPIATESPRSEIEFKRSLSTLRSAGSAEEPALESLSRLIEGRIDEAVRLLEGHGAAGLNDLAVAYLTRGQGPGHSLDLLHALELLDQAAQADPRSPEVVFNRALALQALHLRLLASRAFADFLKLEPRGEWANMARRNLLVLRGEQQRLAWSQLKSRLSVAEPAAEDLLAAAEFPYESRELCEGTWLRQAMASAEAGDSDAAIAAVEKARSLAAILFEKRRDRLLLDTTSGLLELLQDGDPDAIRRTGGALRLYFDGLDHNAGRRYRSAEPILRQAAGKLRSIGCPLVFKAELAAEIARHYDNAAKSALRMTALCSRIPDQFPELEGRCLWMLGIAKGGEGSFEDSARAYLEARDLIERTTGEARAANLDLVLAENLDGRGEVARAWTFRSRAMSILAYQNDPQRRYGALIEASQALGRNRRAAVALIFLEEAKSLVGETYPEPYARSEVELEIASNLLRLGQPDAASEHLGSARSLIASLEPSDFRDRLEAQARLIQGQLILPSDPSGAYREFQAVEQADRRSSFRFNELPLLLALASAQDASGHADAYRSTLARAVRGLEKVRREIRGLAESSESFRRAKEIFDRLILTALDRQDPAEAFAWAERSRAQAIVDRWRRGSQPAGGLASLDEVGARLAPNEVLLEFVATKDRLLCWVFAKGQAKLVHLTTDRTRLAGQIEDFLASLQRSAPIRTLREQGAALHRELIEPLGLDLAPGSHWVVVADEPVRQVPFAALVDGQTGAYLAEKVTISTAPSATLFLLARDKERTFSHQLRTLVVGLGRISSGPYSGLDPLPGAREEAEAIVALRPGSLRLFDDDATRGNLRESLSRADVLHFSGHGIASPHNPEGGALVLTPAGPDDDGLMRLADLDAMPAGKLRLVTLSACETLRGYETGREGALSLAQAFFAAGAPAVIGTRWRIDDASSSALMKDFYLALAAGRPAEALHRARLASLRSGRRPQASPANWAAFELIGW